MSIEVRPRKSFSIVTLEIRFEHDVVLARQRARQIAELMGFDTQDQARIATAVSEIVRNAFRYAGGGKISFAAEEGVPWKLGIQVSDSGPGIARLTDVLDGLYRSQTGMGLGLVGTRRLMDEFTIDSEPGKGTTVRLAKYLSPRATSPTAESLARIGEVLHRLAPENPYEELQRQNQELLRALDQLRQRQDEIERLNRELEDTNRGVVALYAELDERASYLRRVSDLKSRFLSNMSHEFRTPLNSILSLTRMLLTGTDGQLNTEQARQVTFIRRSAEDLSELVNDLLDLAKVEAGKLNVYPKEFSVHELFGALRGVLKPLTEQQKKVELHFEEAAKMPILRTDEGKVSQVLRNFISNALKFTPSGEVRASATLLPNGLVRFAVTDTGIGIAAEDQERIFEEFSQVENPLQKKVKGTGLGLPLSRKLAELLGGRVQVESEPGKGSTFTLEIPKDYAPRSAQQGDATVPGTDASDNGRAAEERPIVLIVDDDEIARYVLRSQLSHRPVSILEAVSGKEGLRLAKEVRPSVIFLDLAMPDLHGFQVLDHLKNEEVTRTIPVIIYTSMTVSPEHRQYLSECGARLLQKDTGSSEAAVRILDELLSPGGSRPARSVEAAGG